MKLFTLVIAYVIYLTALYPNDNNEWIIRERYSNGKKPKEIPRGVNLY